MNILSFKFTPVQFFAVIAILAGVAVSYYPPPTNGAAIWALISGFLGYGVRDLFTPHPSATAAETPASLSEGAITNKLLTKMMSGGEPLNITPPAPPPQDQAGFARASLMAVLALLMLVILSGCSMMSPVVDKAEQTAATAVVQSAERTICRDIPVGTWQREYGTSAARAQAWRDLCAEPAEVPTTKSIEAPK